MAALYEALSTRHMQSKMPESKFVPGAVPYGLQIRTSADGSASMGKILIKTSSALLLDFCIDRNSKIKHRFRIPIPSLSGKKHVAPEGIHVALLLLALSRQKRIANPFRPIAWGGLDSTEFANLRVTMRQDFPSLQLRRANGTVFNEVDIREVIMGE
jgi:hypothetical protein